MYNKSKSESPRNAIQIYIDGKRYRSIFQATSDTNINFPNLVNRLKQANGGFIKIKNHQIVSEQWLLEHPDFLEV